ncbi:MAG: MFS transporter [Chloroflexota bacterium]
MLGFRRARRLLPLTFLFLLIEFVDELHYGMQGAVLPSLRSDLGLSYAQVGLLLGLPGMLGTFLELGVMVLADTRLRQRLVVGGGLLVALGVLGIAAASSFPMALLAFVVVFPASGAFVTLAQGTLMELNPGREPQMMARWTVAGALGNLAGPALIAGGFALGIGWRWSYVALAVMAAGLALLAAAGRFPARPASPREHSEPPHASDDADEAAPAAASGLAAQVKEVLVGMAAAVRNPRLLRWFILLDLSDLLLDVYTGYAALYFADVVALDEAQVSLAVTALMAVGLASNLVLVPVLERVPGRRLVRRTALLAGALYIAWLALPWTWAKIALALAVRFTTLGWYEVLQGEAYAALPGRSGTVMAINSLFGILGGGLAWLIGWFAAQAGLPAAMWLLLAGPLALALFTPREHSPAQPDAEPPEQAE